MSRSPTTTTARQKSWRPLALPGEAAALPRPFSYCRSLTPIPPPAPRSPSAVARSHILAAGFIARHTQAAHLTPIPPPAPRSPRAAASHHLTMELSASDITWLAEAEDDLRDTAVYRPSPFLRAPTAIERQREAASALSATRTNASEMGGSRGLWLRASLANKSFVFVLCAAVACVYVALAILAAVRSDWTVDTVRQVERPLPLTQEARAAPPARHDVASSPVAPFEETVPDVSSLPLERSEDTAPDVSSLPLEPSEGGASGASSRPLELKSKRSRAVITSQTSKFHPKAASASQSVTRVRRLERTRRH